MIREYLDALDSRQVQLSPRVRLFDVRLPRGVPELERNGVIDE